MNSLIILSPMSKKHPNSSTLIPHLIMLSNIVFILKFPNSSNQIVKYSRFITHFLISS